MSKEEARSWSLLAWSLHQGSRNAAAKVPWHHISTSAVAAKELESNNLFIHNFHSKPKLLPSSLNFFRFQRGANPRSKAKMSTSKNMVVYLDGKGKDDESQGMSEEMKHISQVYVIIWTPTYSYMSSYGALCHRCAFWHRCIWWWPSCRTWTAWG